MPDPELHYSERLDPDKLKMALSLKIFPSNKGGGDTIEASNDQLTSATSRADFTDFMCIFLFGINVNIGLSFQTFGKGKKGNLFTDAILCTGSYR